MGTATTMTAGQAAGTKATDDPKTKGGAAVAANPFVAVAREYTEAYYDQSTLMTAALQARNDNQVATGGFIRGIHVLVTASGAVDATDAVGATNSPWNVLANIAVKDANGTQFIQPIDGYDLYLINKWGGYWWQSNPTSDPAYSAMDGDGNFTFALFIPVEITSRDAYGALPNQSDSQVFRVDYSIAASSTVYTTIPDTTLPTVRVQMTTFNWTQPPAQDLQGKPNERTPPGLGAQQMWTKQIYNVNAGAQRINFDRFGNLIRNWIFIWYNDATPSVRAEDFPTSFRFAIDNVVLHDNELLVMRRGLMQRRFGFSFDTGVLVFDGTSDMDGHAGDELHGAYIPTTIASKIVFEGTFPGAGTLHILTNDVAPQGAALAAA